MLGRKRESILQREWKTKESKSVWAKSYPRKRRPYVLGPDYGWTNVIFILGSVSVAVLVAGEAGAHAHLNTCGECPDSPGKVAL